MMKDALFAGVNAAVLTPMRADLSVDLDRMAKHCSWLLANGCNNLGVLGTTGMSTMDYFLGDAEMPCPGTEHLFTERVYRLPRAFCC